MRKLVVISLVILALAGCGDGRDGGEAAPEESPSFRNSTVIIETDDGPVLVDVDIADTPERRAIGLSKRESLPEDKGMVFLFFEDTSTGFWMKDTLIPLSIAFFDDTGKIVEIMDMDLCDDECPTYLPSQPYRGALEVNQGAFGEWGVEVGDRLRISP